MKRLLHTTALTLVILSFNSAGYGNTQFPYIFSSNQFPESQAKLVRHSFQLQIPEKSRLMEQMTINLPDGLRIGDKISIFDNFSRKIDANISINDGKIIITFLQPVPSGTRLRFDMDNVHITGISNGWMYRISAKFIGLDADIPLGIARIGVY